MNDQKLNPRFSNICSTIFCDSFEHTDKQFYDYLCHLNYIRYFRGQREKSEQEKEHWQMYIEFRTRQYLSKLKKDFCNSFLEERKGTQEEAMDYSWKIETRIGEPFEWGIPKRSQRKKKQIILEKQQNEKNKNDTLLVDLLFKIRNKDYQCIDEIKKEQPVLFSRYYSIVREIWNELHPINPFCNSQCQVIWCFGKSGSGKTVWTNKYLRKQKWKENEVAIINPLNMTYSDRIMFELAHEKSKVLVINEVDEEFPKHNNLITFIDKNGWLNTRFGTIKNNFELIIINSLYPPERVFKCLLKEDATQILRRIYNKTFGCLVLECKANEQQLAKIKKAMDDFRFQDWYEPIVIKHQEPDYSLFEGKT